MGKDFWEPVLEASISVEEGDSPKFSCTIQAGYAKKSVSIYLNERTIKKAALRMLIENLSPHVEKDIKPVAQAIVDDLFDRFGAKGFLEWDPDKVASCNEDWAVRMLRRDLKARGLPDSVPFERVRQLLDEIYVVEPVLRA